MEQHAGQVEGTIFAAHGAARNRMVRAAVVAGAALVVAWVVALALGVMGGFGSLPLLPSNHSNSSSETKSSSERSAPAHPAPAAAPVVKPLARAKATGGRTAPRSGAAGRRGHRTASHAPAPRVKPAHPVQTAKNPPLTAHGGQASGTTHSTGKPAGSPGNGPGGSGAPGHLR
jgi:hypothetical protein